MSGNIFISYRRSDSAKDARALYERLRREFGENKVFIDLEGIEPGEDFVESLERQLDGCEALVALISRDWVEARNEHGERRLDDPNDFVRIELGASFRRGVKVFPVLIDGARPPRASELPEDLRPLVRRQALVLDYSKFDADVARLARAIRKALEPPVPHFAATAAPRPRARAEVGERAAGPSPPATDGAARSEPSVAPTVDDLPAEPTVGHEARGAQARWPSRGTVGSLAGVVLLFALFWIVSRLVSPSAAPETGPPASLGPSATVAPAPGAAAEETSNRARVNARGIGASPGSDVLGESEAVKQYRVKAKLGDAKAQSNLGFMYQMGRGGLPQSDTEAVKWFRLAAEQGDAAGQAGLADAYENGTGGLRKDRSEAIRLYRLSAAQGNPVATVALRRLSDMSHAENIIQSIGR